MGRRKPPGLQKRGQFWCIDKRIKGYGRLVESCGTSDLYEAERYLAHRMEEIRQAMVYGVRPTRTFRQAALKYLEDYQHKKSLQRDIYSLDRAIPHIGQLRLDRIHNDTLAQYRRARRADGVSAGTINKELSCIRRILNLAARVWRHDNGMSWLEAPPLIEMEQGAGKEALSTQLGGTGSFLPRATRAPPTYCLVQGEYGLQETGSIATQMELGSAGTRARYKRIRLAHQRAVSD